MKFRAPRFRAPRFREMQPYNQRLWLAVLVAAAIVFQLTLAVRLFIALGQGYLPHDFLAYDGAVRHLLGGQPLYDTTATETGGLGLFLYPPSFALLMLPVALLPTDIAAPLWMFVLIGLALLAVWLMPVSRVIRWLLTLGLAVSWPFIDSLAQGQVGPVLLLLFVIGWRSLDRPRILGLVLALGTTIKIQPAVVIGWAALTRRFEATAVAIGVAGALALVATVIVGPQAWADLVTVLANTNRPELTMNSVGIGRVVYEAGASAAVANAAYVVSIVAAGLATLAAIRWASPTASFIAAALASQMISPVIWPHYAIVLFLPVAWRLARRRWWAILILAATSVPISDVAPAIVYPVLFWLSLLAVIREGVLERGAPANRRVGTPARRAGTPA
jgi:alpha-1,2-mannosyltransferase